MLENGDIASQNGGNVERTRGVVRKSEAAAAADGSNAFFVVCNSIRKRWLLLLRGGCFSAAAVAVGITRFLALEERQKESDHVIPLLLLPLIRSTRAMKILAWLHSDPLENPWQMYCSC